MSPYLWLIVITIYPAGSNQWFGEEPKVIEMEVDEATCHRIHKQSRSLRRENDSVIVQCHQRIRRDGGGKK